MTKRTHDVLFVIGLLIVPIVHFCLFWIYVNFSSISMGGVYVRVFRNVLRRT